MLTHLRIVQARVPGTDGYRDGLRPRLQGLFAARGFPHFYVTLSPADVRNPLVLHVADPALLLELQRRYGQDAVQAFDPREALCGMAGPNVSMPSNMDMHRVVSDDPVCAVKFFYRVVILALRELFGARCPFTGDTTPPDGCAASGLFGCVGDVDAFFGVTEAQQRGSLHVHLFLWLLAQWNAAGIAGSLDAAFFGPDGLRERMLRYVEMATQASVDLLHRKLGLPRRPEGVPPMMQRTADLEEAGQTADPDTAADTDLELDDEQQWAHERFAYQCQATDNNAPLTGMASSRLGPYGEGLQFYADRGPPGSGSVEVDEDARQWAGVAIGDAWDVTADSGLHACRRTCMRKRAVLGIVCRAMFWHLLEHGARWLLCPGKRLRTPEPDVPLAAEVDEGIDAGGQRRGSVPGPARREHRGVGTETMVALKQ